MDILCPLINLYSVYLLGSNTVLGLDMSKHHTNLGDDQGRLRRKILTTRARFRCEKCGHRVTAGRVSRLGSRRCELHHVVPLSQGGFHVPGNVRLLCVNCHRLIHRNEWMKTLPPARRAWAQYLEESYE